MTQSDIVQKVWNYCNVLRDDGVSYGDYLEQLTYLLFLKMAYEYSKPPYNRESIIPKGLDWESLKSKEGSELEAHYIKILQELGKKSGLLGLIFRKAQNKIQDPAKLKRLILLIDKENWVGMDIDVKGEIYEGLLQKYAEDTKSGAGQYFTPRPLIKAIIEVMKPAPNMTICDPACGTGGFLIAAYEYITKHYPLDKEQKEFLKNKAFKGWEIVDNTARLCAMNLYLHGIGGENSVPVIVQDALSSDPGERFDMVLTNPPFGKKSSITITNEEGKEDKGELIYKRDDFWVTTSNKQLNFIQHVKTILKQGGKAAIIVPDNVLFERGSAEILRRKMLEKFDLHTILRLPTGIFYASGVKTNVLFFDKKRSVTRKLWIYDLRTNLRFTLKKKPITFSVFNDFISSFKADDIVNRVESERFRSFAYDDLLKREHVNLDITWVNKDKKLSQSESPQVLVNEIVEELERVLEIFKKLKNAK